MLPCDLLSNWCIWKMVLNKSRQKYIVPIVSVNILVGPLCHGRLLVLLEILFLLLSSESLQRFLWFKVFISDVDLKNFWFVSSNAMVLINDRWSRVNVTLGNPSYFKQHQFSISLWFRRIIDTIIRSLPTILALVVFYFTKQLNIYFAIAIFQSLKK